MCVCSARYGQHFSQRHGFSVSSHEYGDLQHWQSQEASPQQRGESDLYALTHLKSSNGRSHKSFTLKIFYGVNILLNLSSLCIQGKVKADRNRARVEENFLKQTHAQRQEAAQTRREEKKRAEKERIMNEEDPERQRRLEVRILKCQKLKWKSNERTGTNVLNMQLFNCICPVWVLFFSGSSSATWTEEDWEEANEDEANQSESHVKRTAHHMDTH